MSSTTAPTPTLTKRERREAKVAAARQTSSSYTIRYQRRPRLDVESGRWVWDRASGPIDPSRPHELPVELFKAYGVAMDDGFADPAEANQAADIAAVLLVRQFRAGLLRVDDSGSLIVIA